MDASNYNAPQALGRYRQTALIGGAVLLVAASAVAFLAGGPVQFFRSYLAGFFFVTGLAVGSLVWLMLGHMTGGGWAIMSRRIFEAATRTLPLVALLFLPLVAALFVHDSHGHSLYEWTHREAVEADKALKHKSTYLNIPFFVGRGLFYFAVWWVLQHFMNKWSLQQDGTGDPRIRRKMQDVSGPGILLFGFTVTFAAVDWGMSLEPHWFSTIYGLIAMAGWGLSALALMITVSSFLVRDEPLRDVYAPVHFHDWGKLLLAMVMLYAYFSFSQFLITWSGNLLEEIPFYLRRLRGGWQFVALALILFHFALPFALLLSRSLKRHGSTLRRVAVLLLFMRVIDLVFLFAPAVHQGGDQTANIRPLDFVTMLGVTGGLVGIWLFFFFAQLARRPLVPLGEPNLEKALEAAHAHH